MAYDTGILQEDNENEGVNVLSQQNPLSIVDQNNIAVSGAQSSAIQAGQAAPKTKKTPKSGLFTNINKYLDLNKPAVGKMGGAVVDKVGEEAQSVGNVIQQQRQGYRRRIDLAKQDLVGLQKQGRDIVKQVDRTGQVDLKDLTDINNVFVAGDNYPSVDHIKPISKGGTHTWDNIQLAHRYCNTIKSDNDYYENEYNQLTFSL